MRVVNLNFTDIFAHNSTAQVVGTDFKQCVFDLFHVQHFKNITPIRIETSIPKFQHPITTNDIEHFIRCYQYYWGSLFQSEDLSNILTSVKVVYVGPRADTNGPWRIETPTRNTKEDYFRFKRPTKIFEDGTTKLQGYKPIYLGYFEIPNRF